MKCTFKRVTKKMSADARNFMNNLIEYFHVVFKKKYTFIHRNVGSVVYNTALLVDGKYDLDYQILFTKNSPYYLKNGKLDSNVLHKDFKSALDSYFSTNRIRGSVQESTTAFTLLFEDRNYSIDIVLIGFVPENNEIVRRKQGNNYGWDQLPTKNDDAYRKFHELKDRDKIDLIENYILPKKIIEKNKDDGNPKKKSSSQIFIEEVNNYVPRR